MRSDVVKVKRDADGIFMGEEEERSVYDMLSDLLPEIKDNETKSVRISVEIVGEKGEEKVGSKAILRVGRDPVITKSDGGDWIDFFDELAQRNDGRIIKSILFDTPDGVPVVEFVETAEQKLARLKNDLHDAVAEAADGDFGTAWTKIYPAFTELVGIVEGK